MNKTMLSIALVLLIAVTFGCKKQEAATATEPTSMEQAAPAAAPADASAQPEAGAPAAPAQAGQ